MPANTNITVPAKTWTLLTTNDVTQVTFQNLTEGSLLVKGTVGAVAPTDMSGALLYPGYNGEQGIFISDMFPGLLGVNRVYVWSSQGGVVAVSHD